ncbi:MAG: 4-(cytidine 5'-diphospho)-2-C-methyl-D-erythritol kinase [Lachnospiraceae bacterium]|nr:4-(cytidine 5'-diphospho)-2-C-methyl-D-erythritol kinase [uncultured Acetatifactor sp.]MCI9231102.1 4-(cytidine 5'-diphospho)-2-C-methyl-D-erythritol kinase [Lachnospiraceae bacterium]MCI9573679.1 4-(cytidine 5'-diphospho)-2-C-methyl-D-erythritol kinase [Lachnospiraceae bacterium]
MDGYRIKAYAKINLGLDVVRRLPNGYHEVRMVMQNVGLWDELTLERAEGGITITTDADSLPTGEDNLIHKAARLMLDKYGCPGLRVHLRKTIPIAAGMAGGSTDAAAAMKGISHLYGLGLSPAQLMEDGVAIGADVPYCILGGTALAEGIGEKLTPLPPLPFCHILIAKPAVSVSTKYVYQHLDASGIEMHPDIDGMVQAVRDGSLRGVLERMGNVLETVTVPAHPVIADIKARMRELGAADSLMSGSGPTVFGIFLDRGKAEAALERFRQEELAGQAFLTTPV